MGENARKCVWLCKNADECVRYAQALENAIIDFRWAENRWRYELPSSRSAEQ